MSEAGTSNVLADRLRMSMIRLVRQSRRRDTSELTIAQRSALATVVRAGPLGIGRLAEIEALPSPAATRLADKLEVAGLVERRMNPADRRGVLVAATAAGAELYAQREKSGNAWLNERLAGLREVDRRALERAVAVLELLTTEQPDEVATPTEGRRETREIPT